jgi:hypothetical protein
LSGIYTFWVGVILLVWAAILGLISRWAVWKAGHRTRGIGP